MLGLNPAVLYLIVGLAFANLVTLAGWVITDQRFDAFKAEAAAEGARQAAVVAHVEKQQERITHDVSNIWADALGRERALWAGRLRNAGRSQVPGVSRPPAGIDGIPADALAIAADCAETTLMLESLQQWIIRQKDVQ